MFNSFNTVRNRPSSAHLFEDSSDSEGPSASIKKKPKSEDSFVADSRKKLANLNLTSIFDQPTPLEKSVGPKSFKMTEKPKTRVPKLTRPYFDGEGQNADRWMSALKQDFGAQDIDREDYPNLWLEAIYSRVSGKAERWMDRTLHVANIMKDRESYDARS
ncbi:hypothetical protein K3495_g14711 [Podosphaera aphanis]|nr:hypothetical protein K3495_g14711 [Podosphaera aphanis]